MGTVFDSHFLALTAIITVGYQLLFFVITAVLKIDKVTDFAGSTNFVNIAVLTLVLRGTWYFRQVVLTLLVVIWGLRLALFLLMRILQWGEDGRFDNLRNNIGKLAIFWSFQALRVWTWSSLIEATADQQTLSFKNAPENRREMVRCWSMELHSRHPNYFGEAGPSISDPWIRPSSPYIILETTSPREILCLLADKKFGNVAAYRQHERTTSPLIMVPPDIYGKLPVRFSGRKMQEEFEELFIRELKLSSCRTLGLLPPRLRGYLAELQIWDYMAKPLATEPIFIIFLNSA